MKFFLLNAFGMFCDFLPCALMVFLPFPQEALRLRRGLHHHLSVLGALNAEGRQDEITEYLKRYDAAYDHLSERKFSGDPVVDGVLEYYLAIAGADGIGVKCRASVSEGGSGVDAADMTVLLSNCLENAMQAMRPLPAGERRLLTEMVPMRSMILVRVQNTCARSGDSGEPAGWEATSCPSRTEGVSPIATGGRSPWAATRAGCPLSSAKRGAA